jgi:thymidine kinase
MRSQTSGPDAFRSRIILITGPMGAGKTTRLLKMVESENAIKPRGGMEAVILRGSPNLKTPRGEWVQTHDKRAYFAWHGQFTADTILAQLINAYMTPGRLVHPSAYKPEYPRIIGIDEAQFACAKPAQIQAMVAMIQSRFPNTLIIASALNKHARRGFMPGFAQWSALADEIIELRGTCAVPDCLAKATHTAYTGPGSPGVGSLSDGIYAPTCKTHWKNYAPQK